MSRARDVADTQDNLGGAVAPFVAGKNKIINSDYSNWQRGTSFSASGVGYSTDRWWNANGSAGTIERSTDVPSGFAYSLFLNGATGVVIGTPLELPASGAPLFTPGTSVTFSFWAKASTSTTITPILQYRNSKFDSTNQSPFTNSGTAINITSSWARYSFTYTASTPNSSNTILAIELNVPSTLRITGVQLEAGSVMSPFTTASGSIGGELALCQRYFQNDSIVTSGASGYLMQGVASSRIVSNIFFPVQMRTTPTVTMSTSAPYWESIPYIAVGSLTGATVDGTKLSPSGGVLSINGTFGTTPVQSYPGLLGSGQIKYSAEL